MTDTTVATTDSQPPARFDPGQLISEAIAKGTPVETIERLLVMRTQLKQEAAKEAYFRDLARFQKVCPVIIKNAQATGKNSVKTYKWAPLDEIVLKVQGLLADHGFSYMINTEDIGDRPHAVVTGTHLDGHAERSIFPIIQIQGTQIMNEIQVWAASQMYAKRYAFCNLWGIMTGDRDTDGATPQKNPPSPPITGEQLIDLKMLIDETGSDLPALLTVYRVEKLEDMVEAQYDTARKALVRKREGSK